jgi:hypothetical protein
MEASIDCFTLAGSLLPTEHGLGFSDDIRLDALVLALELVAELPTAISFIF